MSAHVPYRGRVGRELAEKGRLLFSLLQVVVECVLSSAMEKYLSAMHALGGKLARLLT